MPKDSQVNEPRLVEHAPEESIEDAKMAFPRVKERTENGITILAPANGKYIRRVMFINVSGGRKTWEDIKAGVLPSNRLWGCIQLVQQGYEVAVIEALPDFYWHRNPFPHDLKLWKFVEHWLGKEGIVYCAHNTLYWLAALRRWRLLKCRIVSLLYAREPLNWSTGHDAVIALTPSAAKHVSLLAPKVQVDCLAWGMDLSFLPLLPYTPGHFLACGRTHRDVHTLQKAAIETEICIRIVDHDGLDRSSWPKNVSFLDGGPGWERRLSYQDLVYQEYSRASASLIIVNQDPEEETACGFTGTIEAMALGRPMITTQTGAAPSELNIDSIGCGIFVPPEDHTAIAEAMDYLAANPEKAAEMGRRGRKAVEERYNIERFGNDLHRFFESLG